MKATTCAALAMAGAAAAFQAPASVGRAQTKLMANSKSIPFAPNPAKLDGTYVGDAGFDPLGITNIDFDFSRIIVPKFATMGPTGNGAPVVDVLYWMRESELKHCRVAMLAVVGWIAVDLGLRLPGSKYVGFDAVSAHDAMVSSGNMTVLLHFVMLLELINGAAILAAAKGSGRKAGNFAVDPLKLENDAAKRARYELSEIKNGRLAMLAIGGIATQAVITGHSFPYLF